jgi:hypothetical protein
MTTPFSGLASALYWREKDPVAMIFAYYDESGEYGSDGTLLNMSIGACVSTREKWERLGVAWRAALEREGLAAFHMPDFEAWVPPFDFRDAEGSRDSERHKRLLNSLLDLMLENIENFAGFAVSGSISIDAARAHRSALEECVVGAVTHAMHDLWRHYRKPINMVFGKQKHFSYAHIMKYIEFYDWGEGHGRIGCVTAGDAASLSQLQAADILAYEMGRAQRDSRPERYPFARLRMGAKKHGIPMTLKWGPIRGTSGDNVASGRAE